MSRFNIAIINGPNLNLLGTREREIYGDLTFEAILKSLQIEFPELSFSYYQSNVEGELVNIIQQCATQHHGIVINPAAYSHYSIAILDALKACTIPKVEVHLSNIYKREEFRAKSLTAQACDGVISGLGKHGYTFAIEYLIKTLDP